MNIKSPRINSQTGFTIVELMIATAVLSTILLMASVLIINIGNLYRKGVAQSNTQDDVRDIVDQVSQDIEFNPGGNITSNSATINVNEQTVSVQSFCIGGSVRYTYVVGYRLGSSGSDPAVTVKGTSETYPHIPAVLWRDDDTDNNSEDVVSSATGDCLPINLGSTTALKDDLSGRELISSDSRLTNFSITPSGSSYTISAGVAYGDIDLLTNQNPGDMSDQTTCAGGTGDQFCAVANLTTTVVQRQ